MRSVLHFAVLLLMFIPLNTLRAEHKYGPKFKIREAPDKIEYAVTIDKNNNRLARVNLSFVSKDSILYMADGANALPKRWATFVQEISAVDAEGNSISLQELPDARWRIDSPLNERITLSYQVHLDHEQYEWSGGLDGVAYATDWGVFYTGRALFILHGTEWETIGIQINVPSDWKVTTPWKPIGGAKASFEVNNQTALSQAMIFAGTHEEISFQREGFELVFALGGEEVLAEKEDYKRLAGGVLDYYIDLMGGLPNPAPDDPLHKSVVIINTHTATDGEVIGNNISILIEADGDAMSKVISKFIFAHEFFHLWNGKSITPVNDETEWFKEGFTNNYTLKALYHVGFLNDNAFFEVLNNLFFQRYNKDEGVGELSMTRGEEKHAHWGLIYGGGLFVAIAQDMLMRQATGNEHSVDDMLKALFEKYGGTNDRYSLEELRETLSELSGKDQTEFFDTYVVGTQRIPIAQFLSMAGLETVIEEGQLLIAKKESPTAMEKEMTRGLLGEGSD